MYRNLMKTTILVVVISTVSITSWTEARVSAEDAIPGTPPTVKHGPLPHKSKEPQIVRPKQLQIGPARGASASKDRLPRPRRGKSDE